MNANSLRAKLLSLLIVIQAPQVLANTGPEYLEFESEQSPISAAFFQYKLPFAEERHNKLHLRSYYFERDRDLAPDSQDWAGGGWFSVVTDYWDDRIKLGGTAYTSQKIYADDDKLDTGLLERGHNSFSGLSELYASLILGSTALQLGRYEINMPYINKSDTRMIPQTFEGASVTFNITPAWTVVSGVVSKIKPKNDSEFISLYEDANVDGDKNVKGIGSIYTGQNGSFAGLYYFDAPEFFDNTYLEVSKQYALGDSRSIQWGGQYTHQQAKGKKLGGDFSVDHFGTKVTWKSPAYSVSAAYTYYSETELLRSPWGSVPGYTSVMVKDFSRPGEHAGLIAMTWYLKAMGAPDIEANIKYVDGDTPDCGSQASPDQQETDITIQYKPAPEYLRGLSFRVRKAWVEQQHSCRGNDARDLEDIRLMLNYQLSF
ncbi:OprD family outer membrane porin [Oceanicoccus sagamiensis]|uniref:OprD family outer membrane porin n=1 Tax=Oceanicoccus sagamiensis TaxID=716816 RepID=UPI00146E0F47|nr:OprD family outer membrane porin [Oceanicoccus sagamiensis]